ncbi:MAG: GHKL domain-containing protein [Lachnospiraceae bacterium]|nr:GHKL domain-containing protein [Lachnospiraceae bacterium]
MGYALVSLAAALLFPILLNSSLQYIFPDDNVRASFCMLTAAAVLAIVWFLLVSEAAIKKILVLLLALIYAFTQYAIVNLIGSLLPEEMRSEIYSGSYLFLFAATAAVMFPLSALGMKKVVSNYIRGLDEQNMRKEFGIVVGVSLGYTVVLLIYSSGIGGEFREYWWLLAPPLLFVVIVLLTFYWFLFQESVLHRKESEYRKNAQIQQMQYQSITREIENAHRTSHDMNHYLRGLYELLEENRVEEAKEYLDRLVKQVHYREQENYCENKAVNAILQYYAGLARGEGIRFESQADCGDLTIQSMDLTVLLGNILENAIYACQRVKTEPQIDVRIGIIGDSLMILVRNSCGKVYPSGSYRMDNSFLPAEAFASGKQGGGYGLKSIAMTAEKYRGEAGFQFDEQRQKFTTRIRINLHPEML